MKEKISKVKALLLVRAAKTIAAKGILIHQKNRLVERMMMIQTARIAATTAADLQETRAVDPKVEAIKVAEKASHD
jgi:hypothetical protein